MPSIQDNVSDSSDTSQPPSLFDRAVLLKSTSKEALLPFCQLTQHKLLKLLLPEERKITQTEVRSLFDRQW